MSYIGNQPTNVAFLTDTFNGTGSQTAFTMSVAPASTSSVLVAVTGVLQDPSTYSVSGTTLTFSAAPPAGTGNISVRYLGIPASGVTTTAYRTVTEFTATAGQTSFSVPSYTVGYVDVYRNGVMLGTADFTATTGTTVVLGVGATVGDLIRVESFYVSSVLNAIPATAGAVNSTYIANGAVGSTQIANGAVGSTQIAAGGVAQSNLAAGVAGTGPAFSAYLSGANQSVSPNTLTKVQLNAEEFDTNNCFDSTTNYRFTPNVAGYYLISGCAYSSAGVYGSNMKVAIYKNGSVQKTSSWEGNTNVGQVLNVGNLTVSSVFYMNGTTDYIELYASNSYSSGGIIVSGVQNTYMSGVLLRTA